MTFDLGYSDPAWRFANWSNGEMAKYGEKWAKRMGRSPYPVMTTEDICKMPVGDLFGPNAIMLMWATSPKIADGSAHAVLKAWGFTAVTIGFVWIKMNPSGKGLHMGLGYHSRQNAEFIFIATRGKGLPRVATDVHSVITYPRGRHSAKPPIARNRIERLYGDVSRVELFARDVVPNWSRYGNEVVCSEGTEPLWDYLIPPIEAILDEDEFQGLPVEDTLQTSWDNGEQIRLM